MSSPLSSLSLEMATFGEQARTTRSQDTLPMYTSDVLPPYTPRALDTLQERERQHVRNDFVAPAAPAVAPTDNPNGQPVPEAPLSHRATVASFLFRSRKETVIALVVLTFIVVGIYVGYKQKSQATQV
ncbi:hypothetical protein PC9H_009824 [Pleurotus ostreatus]|uniref:Transmembrane protein n=2 Tax=Pleurotus TaxID=5320 RepID=A0A8H6ZPS5_PLEOS|nr:uncharacterized protein PC9H_009824 [Pleurotus ostreatus]KAF7424517.1 hypothetical protein PC9H_009824 [Pleurotus ostreatus]KAG9224945.1 hypothetical protein CCMSSC00406_0001904 [Pleurotus cornucopiae]KAJ8692532.1 hypothetical protein PTI98_009836 [Pleurotus ostreatus]